MATRTEELRIKLSIDESGKVQAAIAGAGGGLRRIDQDARRASGGFASLRASALGVRTALTGLGVGLVLRRVVTETTEAAGAQRSLETAIRSTGSAAGVSVSDVNSLATELQRLTGIDDDSIVQLSARILRMKGVSAETFPRIAQDALDVAAALGREPVAAAETLARALARPAEAGRQLRSINVILSESERELIKDLTAANKTLEAQRVVLDAVERSYGGAAEGARNTLGGAIKALQTGIGNLLEQDDGLPGVAAALNSVTDALADPKVKSAADSFFASIITGAAAAIEKLIELGNSLPKGAGAGAARGAAVGFGFGAVTGVGALPAAAVGAVAGGVTGATKESLFGESVPDATKDVAALNKEIVELQKKLAEVSGTIEIGPLFGQSSADLLARISELKKVRQELLAATQTSLPTGIPGLGAAGPANLPAELAGGPQIFPPLQPGVQPAESRFAGSGTPGDPLRNAVAAPVTVSLALVEQSADQLLGTITQTIAGVRERLLESPDGKITIGLAAQAEIERAEEQIAVLRKKIAAEKDLEKRIVLKAELAQLQKDFEQAKQGIGGSPIPIQVETAAALNRVRQIAQEKEALGDKPVPLDLELREENVRADLERLRAEAADKPFEVRVDATADITKAQSIIDGERSRQESDPVELDVTADTSAVEQELSDLKERIAKPLGSTGGLLLGVEVEPFIQRLDDLKRAGDDAGLADLARDLDAAIASIGRVDSFSPFASFLLTNINRLNQLREQALAAAHQVAVLQRTLNDTGGSGGLDIPVTISGSPKLPASEYVGPGGYLDRMLENLTSRSRRLTIGTNASEVVRSATRERTPTGDRRGALGGSEMLLWQEQNELLAANLRIGRRIERAISGGRMASTNARQIDGLLKRARGTGLYR